MLHNHLIYCIQYALHLKEGFFPPKKIPRTTDRDACIQFVSLQQHPGTTVPTWSVP